MDQDFGLFESHIGERRLLQSKVFICTSNFTPPITKLVTTR
nr:uncharacterized protein CTRU02_11839 [Colletotrichum truncatum]KAF6785214.1 hypothetical protein CTRU02_11839 [Colletotrichum truncatum]